MMSVKNADAKTSRIVTVMKNRDGPFSIEPVLTASHRIAMRTGTSRNIEKPTATSKMYSAIRPLPAFTKAIDKASSTQPTTSFPTPALSTTMPTVVSRSFSSVKIRHRTGNAVMPTATAVKRRKYP